MLSKHAVFNNTVLLKLRNVALLYGVARFEKTQFAIALLRHFESLNIRHFPMDAALRPDYLPVFANTTTVKYRAGDN